VNLIIKQKKELPKNGCKANFSKKIFNLGKEAKI